MTLSDSTTRRPSRNPPWAEEELILALDLYLRLGLLGVAHPAVVGLSRALNAMSIHSERPDAVLFRNPNGVRLKLANFAALDPNYRGRGMTRGGKLAAEVWDRYASDEDKLAAIAAAVAGGIEPPTARPTEPARPQVIEAEVEAQHAERFQVSVPDQVREADRRESTLVLDYRDHLASQGRRVTRHLYPLHEGGSPLACDLVDETEHVLYEAKGDLRRPSVRMAIGQLLDYRRFERTPMSIAVLLPRQPAQDLVDLICSVPASAVWRTTDGFASSQPSSAS